MKSNIKYFFLFLILVAIDQISKKSFSIIVCNKNIAWNIPTVPAIFYLAWIGIVIGFIYLYLKTKNTWQKVLLILILSGAVSNMFDRINYGCVIDYIDLKFWPVFNIADSYITVGIILLIIIKFRR